MAEPNPELQIKLQELEHELEEGDITQKGCVLLPLFRFRRLLGMSLFRPTAVSGALSDIALCCGDMR